MFSNTMAPTLIELRIKKPDGDIIMISGYLLKVTEHKEEIEMRYIIEIACPNGSLSMPTDATKWALEDK